MKLLEYKAQALFQQYGIPVMEGVVLDSAAGVAEKIGEAKLSYPVVIKAQVQIGGRGKAGGIQFAESEAEAAEKAQTLMGADIRGYLVKELFVVEKAQIATEWYLSILLDRLTKSPLLIFSAMGGMEIEETARVSPEKIAKVPINPIYGIQDYTITYLIDKTGIDPAMRGKLKAVAEKLYRAFFDYSCMLIEINPLIVDESGELVAIDGKVEIDDSALYRLPDMLAFRDSHEDDDLVREARSFRFHFVRIADEGEIGVMSNGSGMLMSCIDLISKKGMQVGAALDLGGGATAERIQEAVRIVLGCEKIHTVFISIFGGITRCDEVAKGVKMALLQQPAHKRVVIRMEGTNKEIGIAILQDSPVTVVESIPAGVSALYERKEVTK